MEAKLIQLRTKLEFYKKLDKKIEKVMNAELELDEWANEVYSKISSIENELTGLKCEMDLSDEEWDEVSRSFIGLFMHYDNGDMVNIQDLPKPEYENFLEQMNALRMAYIALVSRL